MNHLTTLVPKSFGVFLLLLILVLIPDLSPAPIVSTCSSLDEALAECDTVAVVRVLESRRDRMWFKESKERRERGEPFQSADMFGPVSMGESEDRFVVVAKTLQGDLPEGVECVLRMRPESKATLPGKFRDKVFWVDSVGDTETTQVLHLVFLRKAADVAAGEGSEQPALAYGLDCQEGNFPLHRQTNLDVMAGANLKERITALAEDSKRLYTGTNGEGSAGSYVNWCLGKSYKIWRKAPETDVAAEKPREHVGY